MRRRAALLSCLLTLTPYVSMPAAAQEPWQNPPEPILSMLDAERLPTVLISPDNRWLVTLERPALPPIAQLAEPVVAIAGIEINPNTWGPARESAYEGITIRPLMANTDTPVVLPPEARIRNLRWSRDSRYLAFTLTQADGIELWVLDAATGKARSLTEPILNVTYGAPCQWLPGNEGLICKIRIEAGPPPEAETVPTGPIIEASSGRLAPARTYTNLLQSPHDEALFEHYMNSQLARVGLDGSLTPLGNADLVRSLATSPDGQYILRGTFQKPFSYQVPLSRFATRYEVVNLAGEVVYVAAEQPLAEEIPVAFDSVRPGKRSLSWRSDQPATLKWVEALDGGDSRESAEFRDAVYTLAAPFDQSSELLWRTNLRFRGITWGKDDLAIVYEAWYDSRQLKTWRIHPDDPTQAPVLLSQRDFQDAYADPGDPVEVRNEYGRSVLMLASDGESIYMTGNGASPEGVFPFLDQLNLSTGETTRLWQSSGGPFAQVRRLLDDQATAVIIRQQSQTTPPNYYRLQLPEDASTALTQFSDPLPWYADVHKEIVRYDRGDGVTLTATLYLPPGYNAEQDGPLPTVLWVYPQEYKDANVASQVTRSENTFTRPGRDSVLFLLTQGYAILAGPTMPIVGEGDAEPNDTYLEQLVTSAQAAVNYLQNRGVADCRLAIGGHSYGAFTTANLLAHSDLFQAGIARSGAYNRSLTPFGFQGEQRTFWEATETYSRLSPFFAADQINEPILLIHGADDNNPGTYPIQSERLYEALRGLGGTVRYVSLPAEGHGYRSREAVGHVLWEMVSWLDKHVKDSEKGC
ncbi:MAG: prolyl oligopeptidase family serine peptidase [Cyanobacteria bacterium J06627_15]